MLKNKHDIFRFINERATSEGWYKYYGNDAFSFKSRSGTYGNNCNTRIIYKNGNWYIYDWGQGWGDLIETPKTETDIVNMLWYNRANVNKAIKYYKETFK